MSRAPEPSGPRDVQLEIDARWWELPVHDEVDEPGWSRDLVDDALAARGMTERPERRQVYADMYSQLLASLRSTADDPDLRLITAYCYLPDADLLYAALARLAALVLPTGSTLDDAVATLVASADDRYGDERVSEMETASGPCLRIAQLLLDPATGGDSGVTSSIAYLWPTGDDGVFLVLACTFASPVEGALHEEALDELAASLVRGELV